MTNTVTRLSAIVLAGVVAAAAFGLYTFEVAAYQGGNHGGNNGDRTDIEVENENTTVSNNVSVTANTGGNEAEGGDGGGNSGNRHHRGGHGHNQNGNGGPGGDGGTIVTGAATAIGTVDNDVNSNRVVVEGCGCDDQPVIPYFHFFRFGDDGKVIKIEAENEDTTVRNGLEVLANTGDNDADGGDGGSSGKSRGHHPWMMWFHQYNQNDASGGDGGTIRTGVAYADGLITNVVNRNVVRVLNGDEVPPEA